MISFKQVTKAFDGQTVLDSISFDIPKGSAFGLIGSNGAGKSTILRLMSGVYQPDSGEVLLDGKPIFNSPDNKCRVFFVSDETVQYHSFTIKSLANFYKLYYPRFSDALLEKMLKAVSLPTNKPLSTFSKGMKRQAITMIGIAAQPEYLLLDEAFDGLDPAMRKLVRQLLIDRMLEENMTIIISTHNLTEINEICDSAALIHDNRIVFSRSLDDIRSNMHKLQLAFPTDAPAYTKEQLAETGTEILHFEKQQSVYHLVVKGDEEELCKRFSALHPVVCDLIPLTLEEIFIYELEVLGYGNYVFENDEPVSQ